MTTSSQLEDRASQAFADRLFEAFPEWRAYLSAEKASLRVEVPSPTGDPSRKLQLWLDERAVPSLTYGEWHTHEDLFDSADDFLEFLREIVADRQLFLQVASRWNSRWEAIDGAVDEAVRDALTGEYAADLVKVISWSGDLDRTVRREQL